MALKNFLQNLPAAALLSPDKYQEFQTQQKLAGVRDLQIEAMKQRLQDEAGLRNLLQGSAAQGAEPVPEGATPLPLPQIAPSPLGPATEAVLNLPPTAAQPLQKNSDRLTYDYWKTRDPEKARMIEDEIYNHAAQAEKVAGPAAGLKILKESLGIDFALDPVNKTIEVKDAEGTTLVTLDRQGNVIKQQRVGGAPKQPERVTVKEGEQVFERTPTGGFKKILEGAPKVKTPTESEENVVIDQDTATRLKKTVDQLTPGEKLEGRRIWRDKMKPPKDTTTQEESRLDRAFQQNLKRIDDQAGPLRTQLTHLDEAIDIANLRTPAADAHVPIRTILSLVSGSKGFRLNQTEIQSVMGGATNWTNLQRDLNKWSLDPNQPIIPDAQRQQIVQLLQTARNKAQRLVSHYDDAVDRLTDSSSVEGSRRVTNKALRDAENVNDIKNTVVMQTPDGKRWTVPNDPKKIREAEIRFKAKVISE